MNASQRTNFMEQRKAALAELEEIRKNLASVKSELKAEESKAQSVENHLFKHSFTSSVCCFDIDCIIAESLSGFG